MKLSDWARKNGLSYRTAWNLYKKGKLPCKASQIATGTIIVEDNVNSNDLKIELCEKLLNLLKNV